MEDELLNEEHMSVDQIKSEGLVITIGCECQQRDDIILNVNGRATTLGNFLREAKLQSLLTPPEPADYGDESPNPYQDDSDGTDDDLAQPRYVEFPPEMNQSSLEEAEEDIPPASGVEPEMLKSGNDTRVVVVRQQLTDKEEHILPHTDLRIVTDENASHENEKPHGKRKRHKGERHSTETGGKKKHRHHGEKSSKKGSRSHSQSKESGDGHHSVVSKTEIEEEAVMVFDGSGDGNVTEITKSDRHPIDMHIMEKVEPLCVTQRQIIEFRPFHKDKGSVNIPEKVLAKISDVPNKERLATAERIKNLRKKLNLNLRKRNRMALQEISETQKRKEDWSNPEGAPGKVSQRRSQIADCRPSSETLAKDVIPTFYMSQGTNSECPSRLASPEAEHQDGNFEEEEVGKDTPVKKKLTVTGYLKMKSQKNGTLTKTKNSASGSSDSVETKKKVAERVENNTKSPCTHKGDLLASLLKEMKDSKTTASTEISTSETCSDTKEVVGGGIKSRILIGGRKGKDSPVKKESPETVPTKKACVHTEKTPVGDGLCEEDTSVDFSDVPMELDEEEEEVITLGEGMGSDYRKPFTGVPSDEWLDERLRYESFVDEMIERRSPTQIKPARIQPAFGYLHHPMGHHLVSHSSPRLEDMVPKQLVADMIKPLPEESAMAVGSPGENIRKPVFMTCGGEAWSSVAASLKGWQGEMSDSQVERALKQVPEYGGGGTDNTPSQEQGPHGMSQKFCLPPSPGYSPDWSHMTPQGANRYDGSSSDSYYHHASELQVPSSERNTYPHAPEWESSHHYTPELNYPPYHNPELNDPSFQTPELKDSAQHTLQLKDPYTSEITEPSQQPQELCYSRDGPPIVPLEQDHNQRDPRNRHFNQKDSPKLIRIRSYPSSEALNQASLNETSQDSIPRDPRPQYTHLKDSSQTDTSQYQIRGRTLSDSEAGPQYHLQVLVMPIKTFPHVAYTEGPKEDVRQAKCSPGNKDNDNSRSAKPATQGQFHTRTLLMGRDVGPRHIPLRPVHLSKPLDSRGKPRVPPTDPRVPFYRHSLAVLQKEEDDLIKTLLNV